MASAARWILVRIAAKKLSSLVCQKYCSNAVWTSHGTVTSRGHVTLTTYHTPCLDECTVRPTEDNNSWTRMISTCPLQALTVNSVHAWQQDCQTDRQTDMRTDLDRFVGVEQHDWYERKYFLGDAVARSSKVRQSLGDGSHLVQLHLDTADEQQVPVTSSQRSN